MAENDDSIALADTTPPSTSPSSAPSSQLSIEDDSTAVASHGSSSSGQAKRNSKLCRSAKLAAFYVLAEIQSISRLQWVIMATITAIVVPWTYKSYRFAEWTAKLNYLQECRAALPTMSGTARENCERALKAGIKPPPGFKVPRTAEAVAVLRSEIQEWMDAIRFDGKDMALLPRYVYAMAAFLVPCILVLSWSIPLCLYSGRSAAFGNQRNKPSNVRTLLLLDVAAAAAFFFYGVIVPIATREHMVSLVAYQEECAFAKELHDQPWLDCVLILPNGTIGRPMIPEVRLPQPSSSRSIMSTSWGDSISETGFWTASIPLTVSAAPYHTTSSVSVSRTPIGNFVAAGIELHSSGLFTTSATSVNAAVPSDEVPDISWVSTSKIPLKPSSFHPSYVNSNRSVERYALPEHQTGMGISRLQFGYGQLEARTVITDAQPQLSASRTALQSWATPTANSTATVLAKVTATQIADYEVSRPGKNSSSLDHIQGSEEALFSPGMRGGVEIFLTCSLLLYKFGARKNTRKSKVRQHHEHKNVQ